MLTVDIANAIIKETSSKLHYNMNIMDVNGVIIATTDKRRLYTVHEGAQFVIAKGEALFLTKEKASQWKDVRPGINMPIFFRNEIVGVIGITGNPDEILELSEMVRMTTELLIKQTYLISNKGWIQNTKQTLLEEILLYSGSLFEITRKLDVLGYKLSPPYLLILIEPNEPNINRKDMIHHIENYIDTRKSFVACTELNQFAVLTSGNETSTLIASVEKLYDELRRLHPHLRLLHSLPFFSLANAKATYEDCCIGLRHWNAETGWRSYAESESRVLLTDVTHKRASQFSERILSQLKEKEITTLGVYFQKEANIELAAKALNIHRNTLNYRLENIQQKTGLNPKSVQDSFELQLALCLSAIMVQEE